MRQGGRQGSRCPWTVSCTCMACDAPDGGCVVGSGTEQLHVSLWLCPWLRCHEVHPLTLLAGQTLQHKVPCEGPVPPEIVPVSSDIATWTPIPVCGSQELPVPRLPGAGANSHSTRPLIMTKVISILTTILGTYSYYFHFTGEETEAQQG